MIRHRRSALLLTVLALAAPLSSCATGRIEDAYAQRHAEPLTLKREAAPAEATDGPYHFAMRLGPDALAKLIEETVVMKLAQTDLSQGLAGKPELEGKIELAPFGLEGVEVGFPSEAKGVLTARVKLTGKVGIHVADLVEEFTKDSAPPPKGKKGKSSSAAPGLGGLMGGAGGGAGALLQGGGALSDIAGQLTSRLSTIDVRWITLRPTVGVRVMMTSHMEAGRPAIRIDLLDANEFDLGLGETLALPLLEAFVQETARKKVTSQLLAQAGEPQLLMLPESLGKGDLKLAVRGAGVHVVPGNPGELFLGFVTDLASRPQVVPPSRGGGLGQHGFALSLGDETLSLALRAMSRSGGLPLSFDKKGKPDPEGKVKVDLDGLKTSATGFEIAARIWNLGFPAFWQDYTLAGSFALTDGQLKPTIDSMTPGEGDGNAWLGKRIAKKQEDNPKMGVSSAARKAPPSLPLPMSGGKRVMQLDLKEVVTEEGLLTILGGVTLKDAPPPRSE